MTRQNWSELIEVEYGRFPLRIMINALSIDSLLTRQYGKPFELDNLINLGGRVVLCVFPSLVVVYHSSPSD